MNDFVLVRNVVFKEVDGEKLLLDLYIPKVSSPDYLPVLVVIHGGAWCGGDKADEGLNAEYARMAARNGISAISINYRLSQVVTFPAQLEDVQSAILWLCNYAQELKIDVSRIGLLGASAGAHLASLLAVTMSSCAFSTSAVIQSKKVDARIRAVVSICGPQDLLSLALSPPREDLPPVIYQFIGGTPETHNHLYRQASPIFHVNKNTPPFLFIHGEEDPTVPIAQAIQMYKALENCGVSCDFISVHNGLHDPFNPKEGYTVSPSKDEVDEKIKQFLLENLFGG